jgi:transposase
VADVARQHGLNANQVFNWRRMAMARLSGSGAASSAVVPSQPERSAAADPAAFVPLGVATTVDEDGACVQLVASAIGPGMAKRAGSLPNPEAGERAGMIEIVLVDGTRLRVDAFVNERALRRVVSVLRATA